MGREIESILLPRLPIPSLSSPTPPQVIKPERSEIQQRKQLKQFFKIEKAGGPTAARVTAEFPDKGALGSEGRTGASPQFQGVRVAGNFIKRLLCATCVFSVQIRKGFGQKTGRKKEPTPGTAGGRGSGRTYARVCKPGWLGSQPPCKDKRSDTDTHASQAGLQERVK